MCAMPFPVPGQVRRLPFAGAAGAVVRTRAFVRNALQAYGWLPAPDRAVEYLADDVLLVSVELVTNACLHAPGGPVELRLTRLPDGVRVEVDDGSDTEPRPRRPDPDGPPGGHGLQIVRHLGRAWGSVPRPGGGKTVWVELPVEPSVEPPVEPPLPG